MERRKFLSMTLGALALAAVPASVRAEDFRKTKPTVWTAHTVEDGIKNLYGSTTLIESGVKLKAAGESFDSGKKAVASSGGAIPVDFSTEIPAKSIAVFQDANPESAVCVYTVSKYSVNDYSIKIKMGKPGTITVVVEGLDGKLYAAKQTLDVALGGCEG
ncbi:thiosulfate oxidation carrier protein SoxY [Sulfurimonas sp.]|jgi:sulfur-oxidizing protein SoxY|uniref:thiosulfate oxidation carrier protein SoxY n=1 Tax=Sulfurimonas sp. TaxID=2022749 RepID=UPI0025EC5ED3|nr:thiosulfate oxidation carrier protein SoxY [Sulfurimonas sp.]